MKILPSQPTDIPKIFELYRIATDYMKSKGQVHWPEFSGELVTTEVSENRQWKLLIEGQVACIWAIAFDDPLIWGERNKEPSIYIHRIATNPDFRGRSLVKHLLDWAEDYGKTLGKSFIRLDTVGLNQGLIRHYQKMGLEFLGTEELPSTEGLPDHYKMGDVCLFEMKIH